MLAACAQPMCINYCPGGYRYNHYGCMTCDCVGEAARRRPRRSGSRPMCTNFCPGGYKNEADGRKTCDCVEMPPPAVSIFFVFYDFILSFLPLTTNLRR